MINIFLFFLKVTTKFTLEGSDGEQFKKRKKCDLSDIGRGLEYIRQSDLGIRRWVYQNSRDVHEVFVFQNG